MEQNCENHLQEGTLLLLAAKSSIAIKSCTFLSEELSFEIHLRSESAMIELQSITRLLQLHLFTTHSICQIALLALQLLAASLDDYSFLLELQLFLSK